MTLNSLVDRLETEIDAEADTLAADPGLPLLTVRGLQKHFTRANGTAVTAVDGIDLDIKQGEFIVLLGPSGCGKTTLLRCIGGLENATAGFVQIGDKVVFDAERHIDVPTRLRGVSMVFQSYALWPNMSVFENIAYSLKSRRKEAKRTKTEIREAVESIATVVGIHDILKSFPNHISGGQQQRVALARALVSGRALVLFDEPLSNVDAKVRKELRIELAALQGKFGFAAVYVTHDQDDAMELAHRIVVLESGRIAQVGPPEEVYNHPVTKYVATFIGSTNQVQGTVESMDGDLVTVLTALDSRVVAKTSTPFTPGQKVDLLFRPQHGRLSEQEPASVNRWLMRYRRKMQGGTHADVLVTHDHAIYTLRLDADFEPPADENVWVSVDPKHVMIFPADD